MPQSYKIIHKGEEELSFFCNFVRILSFSLISKINPREYPLIKFKGRSFFLLC